MLRRPPPPHAPPQPLSLADTRRAVADADPFISLRVQRNVTLKHFLAASRSAGKPDERHQDPDQCSLHLHVTSSSSTSSRATSLTATGDSSSSALTTASSHPSTGTASLASTTNSSAATAAVTATSTSTTGSAKQNNDAAVLSSRKQRRREMVRTLAHEFSLASSSAAHHAHCGNVLGSLFQSNIQRAESAPPEHDALLMPAPRSRDPSPRPPVLHRDNCSEQENRHGDGDNNDYLCAPEQPQQQQIQQHLGQHQLCPARMSTRRHHNPYNMQRTTIVSHSIVLDGADEHALHADAAIQSHQRQAPQSSLASGLKSSSSSSSSAVAAAATAATQHPPPAPLPCGVEYVLLLNDVRIRALLIDYAAVHASSSSANMFHHLPSREQPDQQLQQQPHLKLGGVSRDMGDTDIAAAIAVISGVRPARVVASTDFFGRAYVWLSDPDAEMERVRRAIDNRVWLGPRFALAPPRLPDSNNNGDDSINGGDHHSDFIVLSCLKHFLAGLRTDIRGGINAPRHFATCEPWVRAHAHPPQWI